MRTATVASSPRQAKGHWREADRLIDDLDNDLLIGTVLAKRYVGGVLPGELRRPSGMARALLGSAGGEGLSAS